nr:2TM domain-containing protein [Methanobrevibacter arboriphilus]
MENYDKKSYYNAKKRVKEVKIFHRSLISYIIINIFLFIINLIFSPGFWWFLFVVAIWGIFIVLQFLRIFVFKNKIFGEDWEDKKIKEYMDKDKKQ